MTAPETGAVLARRRRTVAATGLVGAALLGAGLTAPAGSGRFYGLTAATAATYVAGSLASGPVRRGTGSSQVLVPAALGAGAFGVFYTGGLVARRIPFARRAISRILGYAAKGVDPLVVGVALANGVAEEMYFRGAVYDAAGGRRPLVTTTAAYVVATTATRNPALVFASALMGVLFAVQRKATGGVQAPAITHLVWSVLMLRFLPPLFAEEPIRLAPTAFPDGAAP
jgi:membrane protease YdiL (CAAX protease family)